MTEPGMASLFGRLGLLEDNEHPGKRAEEEALIFILWAHTRGIQQAYRDETTDPASSSREPRT